MSGGSGILGIGTDIVEIARFEGALERFGERFAERILSPGELVEFRNSSSQARMLAKRFAAKEATAKALGTGIRGDISLASIEVSHDRFGRPELRFRGRAVEKARSLGVSDTHLSISDERHYAVAFVLIAVG